MPNEVPRPILRLDIEYTQPLFSRDKYKDEEADHKAKDILAILNLF